jgi:hypothetical protein
MIQTGNAELDDALRTFVSMVSGTGPGPWNHMTCFEAEATANVLRALGYEDMATLVIEDHAEEDDEGDEHYRED